MVDLSYIAGSRSDEPDSGDKRQSQRLRRWRDYQWSVLAVLWIVTAYLGWVGWVRHCAAVGEQRTRWDIVYLTLQLFALESGSVSGPKSWELELARLLAPGLAMYTAFCALASLFREQLRLFRSRFWKDHVVICGLGDKGLLLATRFHERGARVVILERNPDNEYLHPCREQGALVLVGDAAAPEMLSQARVQKAGTLIAVCGDDGANAEVAVAGAGLVQHRKRGMLTCFVHIVDPQLCSLLRQRELAMGVTNCFRVQFFNVYESGARVLAKNHPPFEDQNQSGPPHLVVVGVGYMGQSLVTHLAKSWWPRYQVSGKALRLTLIDRFARRKIEVLRLRYPQLEKCCELDIQDIEISGPEFERADFLHDPQGDSSVTGVYVCLGTDSTSLTAGLRLREQIRDRRVPIVVRTSSTSGLAALLGKHDGTTGVANLHAFPLLEETCDPEWQFESANELLARATHEEYLAQQERDGQTPETNPAMVPWEQLPERLRESSRRQTDHIGTKLAAVSCDLTPLTDWEAPLFEFTPEEVETLGRLEHDRWNQERLHEGWKYAPGPKNIEKKTTPHLVPWDQLSEEIREYDRIPLRELPSFLAKVGLKICRII